MMGTLGFNIILLQLMNILVVSGICYDRCKVYKVFDKESKFPSLSYTRGNLGILTENKELDHNNNICTVRNYLVHENSENDFLKALDIFGARYKILVHDLGKEIVEERKLAENYRLSGTESVFHSYYSYNEICNFLNEISYITNPENSQPIALIEPIGNSYEGKPMHLVKISSNHEEKKPIIFLEAGIHAREWTAPATALYMIYQLVQNYKLNYEALKHIDYYIIPLSNPDGYEYSRKEDRLWRKTRSFYRGRFGVDGNRNFDFHWGEKGSSSEPDSDVFHGPQPFSEPETRNIRDAGMRYKDRIIVFISIHCYGAFILHPWGYKSIKAPQSDIMEEISRDAIKAIKKYNGTNYKQGTSSILLYEAAGGSDDYFKGILGVNLSYTIELSSPTKSFIVPSYRIRNIAGEAFEGIKVIADGALKYHKGEFRRKKHFHVWGVV